MTNLQINKMIELLDKNELQDLRLALTKELFKSTDKTKAKTLDIVSKYLKQMDDSRPLLKTIQHKHGKQFICNGYSAIIFNNYITELDCLPQTDEANSLDWKQILPDCTCDLITSNDYILLKNIKKYIDFYKTTTFYEKKAPILCFFDNKLFDAKLLEPIAQLYANDIDDLKIGNQTKSLYESTRFETDSITAIVLPIRAKDTQEIEKIKNLTDDFTKQITEEGGGWE